MLKFFYYSMLFLIVSFKLNNANTPQFIDQWVVWNIGQGQWVSHILSDECLHYDAGGEFGRFRDIKKSLLFHCGNKKNKLFLSHWDYDHFLNIPQLARHINQVCWEVRPEFADKKQMAQKIISLNIPSCEKQTYPSQTQIWIPDFARNTNESSIIYTDQKVLLTGDSPIQQEKIWSQQISKLEKIEVFVLGHHGSRTSNGQDLLSRLPNLKFSVASARYQKYRHPHLETLKRLAQFKIPVLKTEDWGNVWFKTTH